MKTAIQGHYTDDETHLTRKGSFLSYNDTAYIVSDDYNKMNRFLCAVMTAIRCGKYLDLTHTDNNRKILYFVFGDSQYSRIVTITKEMANSTGRKNKGKIKCVKINCNIKPNEIIALFRTEIAQFSPEFVFVDNCSPMMQKVAQSENMKDLPDGAYKSVEFNRLIEGVFTEHKITAMLGIMCAKGKSKEKINFIRKYKSDIVKNRFYYFEKDYFYAFIDENWKELETVIEDKYQGIQTTYRDTLPYPTNARKGELTKVCLWSMFKDVDLEKTKYDIANSEKCNWSCSTSTMIVKINKAIELGIIRKTKTGYELVPWNEVRI